MLLKEEQLEPSILSSRATFFTGVVAAIHSFRGYIEQTIFDSSYLLRSKLTPLLKNVYLFNHSNCSNPSLEVVVYLFWSMKARQSSILWSVLCRFHSLYHCCHSLSLTAFCCHLLPLVVLLAVTLCAFFTRCHSLSLVAIRCHSLSLVIPPVVTRCHSLSLVVLLVVTCCHLLSLVVTRCTTGLPFYKRSSENIFKTRKVYKVMQNVKPISTAI